MSLEIKTSIEKFIKSHLRQHCCINNIVGEGKCHLANDHLEFDSNPMLFGCENGVWDLKEESFRPYRFNDYVTWTCGYNFVPELQGLKYIKVEEGNDMAYVVMENLTGESGDNYAILSGIFEQIFPDEEVRHLIMTVLCSGLVGQPIEKFFIFNGKGRNGKGFVDEFMQVVLGDYFEYIDPTVLTENQKQKSSKDANPALAKLHKKRYVVAKEPCAKNPLQNNIVKDMTGGGDLQARMLYSSETKVKLFLTLVLECNEKPPFAETPKQADSERIVDIHFGSFFTADSNLWDETTNQHNHVFPLNTEIKSPQWRDKFKNVMLNVLVHYFFLLKQENYIIDKFVCDSVRQRSIAYMQESHDIHVIFQRLFEPFCEEHSGKYKNDKGVVENKDWTISKIVTLIRNSKDFTDLPKSKQREFTAEKTKEFFETNSYYKHAVKTNSTTKQKYLTGWRLKVDEDSEECMVGGN